METIAVEVEHERFERRMQAVEKVRGAAQREALRYLASIGRRGRWLLLCNHSSEVAGVEEAARKCVYDGTGRPYEPLPQLTSWAGLISEDPPPAIRSESPAKKEPNALKPSDEWSEETWSTSANSRFQEEFRFYIYQLIKGAVGGWTEESWSASVTDAIRSLEEVIAEHEEWELKNFAKACSRSGWRLSVTTQVTKSGLRYRIHSRAAGKRLSISVRSPDEARKLMQRWADSTPGRRPVRVQASPPAIVGRDDTSNAVIPMVPSAFRRRA